MENELEKIIFGNAEKDALNERLRGMLELNFQVKNKFVKLEELSGISANKWKNFFYKKQNASLDMVRFWCKSYPNDEEYVVHGIKKQSRTGFPFSAPVPKKKNNKSIRDRFNWVVKEYAATQGDALFHYLEQLSNGAITARQWSMTILEMEEPTIEMLRVIGIRRPHFVEWIVLGECSSYGQVDPSSEESVLQWKALTERAQDQYSAGCAPKP